MRWGEHRNRADNARQLELANRRIPSDRRGRTARSLTRQPGMSWQGMENAFLVSAGASSPGAMRTNCITQVRAKPKIIADNVKPSLLFFAAVPDVQQTNARFAQANRAVPEPMTRDRRSDAVVDATAIVVFFSDLLDKETKARRRKNGIRFGVYKTFTLCTRNRLARTTSDSFRLRERRRRVSVKDSVDDSVKIPRLVAWDRMRPCRSSVETSFSTANGGGDLTRPLVYIVMATNA